MKIAILGGIGPQTSALFYSELIKRLKNSCCIKYREDFPQIILNSITDPGWTCLLTDTLNLAPYRDGINELVSHQPDFIVMACNTIHVYLNELKRQTNFKNILSIQDIASDHLKKINRPLCLIASPATIQSNLYAFPECKYIPLTNKEIITIGKIIDRFIQKNDFEQSQKSLLRIINAARFRGAEHFVLACTEISLLLRNIKTIQTIDTFDLLIDGVVNECLSRINKTNKEKVMPRPA